MEVNTLGFSVFAKLTPGRLQTRLYTESMVLEPLVNPNYRNLVNTPKDKFSGKINQPAKYNNSCLEIAILLKISTNNPSWKLLVLESFVKPSLGCQFGSQGLAGERSKNH